MNKWDRRFLGLAKTVSTWSKDPSTRVGAVLADEHHRVISLGYNGPAQGLEDEGLDRDRKLMRTLHAEMNAILFARRDLTGATIYVTHPPCANCAATIVQVGIDRVVVAPTDVEFAKRWKESITESERILGEVGVVLCKYQEEP